jgi:hypothetical protein
MTMKKLQLLILFFVATAFTYPAKDIKLEYAFKVGDQYTMTQVMHQNIKQSIPGMGDMNIEVDLDGTMNLKIAELTATGARFEVQFQKFKSLTKVPMGMGDVGMDSESTEDNAQNKAAKAMMNKTFYMNLSKIGVVESIEGTDNLYADFGSLGLDDATMSTMKQQLQQVLGSDYQKTNFSNAFVIYPGKKVKALETWSVPGTGQAMSFAVKVNNTMTLKSFDAAKAAISIDGTSESVDKEKVVSLPNGIKSKLNVTGRHAVASSVNSKTGWPTETKGVIETKGTMTLLAGGMIPSDMEIPVEIIEERSYTMVKR